MSKPYGKIFRGRRRPGKTTKGDDRSFKIRVCHEDGAPLSLPETRDGFYHAVRKLMSDPSCHRAKRVTIYVTMIDQSGEEYLPDPKGEWNIHPYRSAADEHGL